MKHYTKEELESYRQHGMSVLGRLTCSAHLKECAACADLLKELDLEKLEYISSAGLRVLLAAQKAMTKQGKMKICNVNETIMEIFDVTGFSDILTIE